MIVIDLGCAVLGHDSVNHLIDRFHPRLLLGYDPWPEMEEGVFDKNGTTVVLNQSAAWTHTGLISYVKDWWASYVTEEPIPIENRTLVPCFDLAALVIALPKPVVLKLNCEGAEYPLLDKLHGLALDATLERCLVQWHDEKRIKLRCPTEEYP